MSIFLSITGVLTESEYKALEDVQTPHGKWWVPFMWSFNIIKDCRTEGRITDDYMLKALMDVSYNLSRLYTE